MNRTGPDRTNPGLQSSQPNPTNPKTNPGLQSRLQSGDVNQSNPTTQPNPTTGPDSGIQTTQPPGPTLESGPVNRTNPTARTQSAIILANKIILAKLCAGDVGLQRHPLTSEIKFSIPHFPLVKIRPLDPRNPGWKPFLPFSKQPHPSEKKYFIFPNPSAKRSSGGGDPLDPQEGLHKTFLTTPLSCATIHSIKSANRKDNQCNSNSPLHRFVRLSPLRNP